MTGRQMLGRMPVIVGLLWLALASTASAQTTTFGPATLYDNGSDTTGLAVADVNQDGHLDLIVAACDSGIIRVRLGIGDGTFGAGTDYAVGEEGEVSLFGLAVADLNGDDFPDIAVGDVVEGRVFILVNNGAGLFGTPVPYPLPAFPQGIAAADFNGDDIPDLAIVSSDFSADYVTILLNFGDATFAEAAGSPMTPGFFPYAIRTGDLNGDDMIDLVIPNVADDTVTILLGVGGGAFVPADGIELAPFTAPVDVAILDFNGDTVPDVAVLGGDAEELLLYAGNGDGTFSAVTPSTPLLTGISPNAMTAADFNGDGILDLAVVHMGDDTAIVFEGNGTDFVVPVDTFLTEDLASPVLVEAGDFNEDGRPDLAAGHAFSDNTAVLLNETCCFVSVTKGGAGTGTVTSVPAGIDCGLDCSEQFAPTDSVQLTAIADAGFVFTGWSGAGCSGNGACVITTGTNASVTATFDPLLLDDIVTTGTVGAPYSSTVVTTNGVPPFTFTLESGTLPPGLDLDGSGTLSGTPTQAGPFTFTIRGTDTDGATGTRQYTITIAAGATSTAPAPSVADYQDAPQTITLVATVLNGADVDGGTVTFTVRDALSAVVGTPATSGAVADGTATADYVLPGGTLPQTLTITAVYSGTANYLTSTGVADLVVQQANTVTAAANATVPFNEASQSVLLSAAVTAAGSVVNAGTVTFTVRDSLSAVVGVAVTSGTVTGGAASASYTLPAGTASQALVVEAVYSGAANFLGSTDTTHTLTVTTAATTTTGANATASFSTVPQIVPLSATVTSAGGTVNAGTVTFTVRDASNAVIGSPLSSVSVVAGAANGAFTLPGGTNAQTLTITAVYEGSTNFATSSDATHTLIVGTAATATAAANAAATYNAAAQIIPLSANVASSGGPVSGGTVTFTLRDAGNAMVGVPVTSGPLAAGLAFVNYTLPGGTSAQTLTITAAYSGSPNFGASTEAGHTLTIGPTATTTTPANAASVSGPAAVNVPLTAAVASAGGTVGAGTVTFTVRTAGSVVVGSSVSGPVVGGTATATYSLPAGTATQTLTVTADYGATTNFLGSTGTSSLIVTQCGTITIGPSALPPVRLGRPYSVTFTAAGISDPSFSLAGTLPAGLTLSGAVLSGTPTALGRFDVSATGTSNSTGCTATQAFTLSVMRSPMFVTGSGGTSPSVRLFDDIGTQTAAFLGEDAAFTGGVRVASADITGDGVADIITAPGAGAPTATVRVYDGVSGAMARTIVAYPGSSLGGLYVAAGDVNADGVPDIITGRDGANSEVRVFDGQTSALIASFLAYAPGVSGVRVAAGDLDADGVAEIITSPPFGSAPQVNVFGPSGALRSSFMAYNPAWIGGLFVAAGDVDGDGFADIVTGADAGGGPHVLAYSGADGHVLQSFFAYEPAFPNGVRVAAGDLNHDGYAEIITAAGPGGGPHVRVFDGASGVEIVGMFAENPAMPGGMFVAAPIGQSRMAIDTPVHGATVPASFSLSGWAALPGSTTDDGVDAIHVWAVPVAGGVPTFAGVPTLGLPRADVAAVLGGAYQDSGFALVTNALPPGVYDLWVFAHSSRSETFTTWRIVRVTVTP